MIVVKTDEGFRIECNVREKVIIQALLEVARNGRNADAFDEELERMALDLRFALCAA